MLFKLDDPDPDEAFFACFLRENIEERVGERVGVVEGDSGDFCSTVEVVSSCGTCGRLFISIDPEEDEAEEEEGFLVA